MLVATVIGLAGLSAGIIYASFFEWTVHRWLMHRPLLHFKHFFIGHAKVHHGRYQADSTYTVGDRLPREITFAWWAMPFPVLLHVPMLIAIAVWVSAPAAVGLFAAFSVYQFCYEYFHYCMHVPGDRWFEQSGAFKWINAHHLQHHRKHNTNLNVVLPIADFLLGSRRRPAQVALAEA